jgi:hypothetical protein
VRYRRSLDGWVARRRVSSGERGAAGAVLEQYSYVLTRTGRNQPLCVCVREREQLVFFSLAKTRARATSGSQEQPHSASITARRLGCRINSGIHLFMKGWAAVHGISARKRPPAS